MDDHRSYKKTRLKFKNLKTNQSEEISCLIPDMGNQAQVSRNKFEASLSPNKHLNMQPFHGHYLIDKKCVSRKNLKKSSIFTRCPTRYLSCTKILFLLSILFMTILQVSNCQKTKPMGQRLFRSEEDFNNFKESRQSLLHNNDPNFMLRKNLGIRQGQHLQKRLGQLNQLQKITGAFNGDVREIPSHTQNNRNGVRNRPILKNGVPQNPKRVGNPNKHKLALRQKQKQPLLLPSDSNRHEIIRNWESYKVKRQNPQLFSSADEPTLDYRYLDVTSEGQVLPPIRRNDRIDEGEGDLTRPQRPIIYYPNVDSAERNSYYPEEEKVEKEDRNKRPLRPYKPKPPPKRTSLPSFPNFIPKFPSFPAAPPFENNNKRKRQPPPNRVKIEPTITPRRTTTRTPWTTSVSYVFPEKLSIDG